MAMKMGTVLTGLALTAATIAGSGEVANAQGNARGEVFRLNQTNAVPDASQGKGISKKFKLNALNITINSNSSNIQKMILAGTESVGDGSFDLFRADLDTDRDRAAGSLTNNAAVYVDEFKNLGNNTYHVKIRLEHSGYSKDQNIIQMTANPKVATEKASFEMVHDIVFEGDIANPQIWDAAKGDSQTVSGNVAQLLDDTRTYGIYIGNFVGDQSNVFEGQRLPPIGQGQREATLIRNYRP